MASTPNHVPRLYQSVVDDVITNVREAFLDESVDEQVLQELKQLWQNKLQQSKALDPVLTEPDTGIQLPTTIQYTSQVMQQQAQPRTQAQQAVHVPVQIATHQGADMSQPAAVAAMALPQGVFQQQLQALAAQGYTILPTSNGQFIIQAAVPQQQPAPGQINVTSIPQQASIVQNRQVPTVVQTSQNTQGVLQFDGADDTSSEEDDDDDNDDDDDENDETRNEDEEAQGEEEEPLNSEDDVSDEDPSDLFDTDNVVVCQYDKINRNKNKWKFYLKDGIMNLNGKDYVFQKANGDAEW